MVGRFYVVVVQTVLLFGSKKWLLTPRLEKSLEGYHHQAVRQMAEGNIHPDLLQTHSFQNRPKWVYTTISHPVNVWYP